MNDKAIASKSQGSPKAKITNMSNAESTVLEDSGFTINRFFTFPNIRSSFIVADVSGNPVYKFSKIIVSALSIVRQEKIQTLEVADGVSVTALGSHPYSVTVSGHFYNTDQEPWREYWQAAYDTKLSAKNLALNGYKLFFAVERLYMQAFIMSYTFDSNASSDGRVGVNIRLLVPQGALDSIYRDISDLSDAEIIKSLQDVSDPIAKSRLKSSYLNKKSFHATL